MKFIMVYLFLLKNPVILFGNNFQVLFLQKFFSLKKNMLINKKKTIFCFKETNEESQYLHELLNNNNNNNTFYHNKKSYLEEINKESQYLHELLYNKSCDINK